MKLAVIGGGLGGMSAAITLSSQGHEVHLYEKSDSLGGKMRAHTVGTAHFDFGPNTITMPEAFKQVLQFSGVNPDDYLTFIPIENHMQNVSVDGKVFFFSNNADEMKAQLAKYSEKDANNYAAFIAEITRLYKLSNEHFLHRTFFSWKEYMNPKLGLAILKVRPFETLEHFIKRYFSDPFIVQCFLRYGTYIGSSPYKMPATFAMIAYLELVEGVYYVKGGTSAIAKAFERRLQELNVHIHLNSEVTDVFKHKYAVHTLEVNGEIADTYHAMVFNTDVLQSKNLLNYQAVNTKEPTTSAIVGLFALNKSIEKLHHHNVFFADDYEKEFEQLFDNQYADHATVYICNSSKSDPSISPDGDNLLVLINAPALTSKNKMTEAEGYSYMMKQLQEKGLFIEDNITAHEIITPETIKNRFTAFRGALYGSASNKKKDAFFRPRNRHPLYHNLFLVGGTVHPGGGSPLVVLGGHYVAKRIMNEYKLKKQPSQK